MRLYQKTFVLVFFILTLFSCSENENSNTDKLPKLDNISLPNLKISGEEIFEFNILDKQQALTKIGEINNDLERAIEEDEFLLMATYKILVDDQKITIRDFEYFERNGEYTSFDALEAWNCPSGTSQVGSNCYTQSCVEGNLATAFEDFGSGDTLVITVHHGGLAGGVKICI